MKKARLFTLLAAGLFFASSCHRGPAYLNPRLPVEKRAMDLVSRMTLDEKISQMMNSAPAIPRLGIPEYDWWSEGLHGVARAGVATVFPQAIGLAAMWDTSTMFTVASVIGDEFRAKYNDFVKRNERGIFKGLTVWSPNINIFRDPRWGRGQETYGEDPYLTGCTGVAFVKGLQGNDPVYLKTVSTPKHFAVHSGPEPFRHQFDARISQRDFLETYTPAFEACVREGGAWSVMGAYNRYMGEACCASNVLLKETLRGKWGFKGYVVSDCGAIDDIYMFHKIVSTPEEAAAMAVKAGCDLNCGNTYQYLKQAVEKGLITEAEIDTAVKRLFIARIKLGMFDPEEKVPFNKIPIEVNDSKEHRALALESARKSIVLLRNQGNLLPLKKENLKTIAVIGPNANSVDALYGNYNGVSSHPVTPLEGIKNKVGNSAKVLYAQGCSYTDATPSLSPVPAEWLSYDGKPGLRAEYFANTDLKDQPVVTRTDAQIDFAWDGTKPAENLENQNFSVRWTGRLTVPETGKYWLAITADDGLRLFVDGKKVLESWIRQAPTTYKTVLSLEKGKPYDLVVEYYQGAGGAMIRFDYGRAEQDPVKEAVRLASQADVILFFGGLSPSLEGEEMPVKVPGFSGGDRTDIALPAIQGNLLKQLYKTGKPMVFVNMSGSAVAFNWAAENIPAILQAWYPGEEGGNAIADVLFGDYNPAGRLPVTFYRSVNDLPPFEDYNMTGRTYKYFTGKPLYPFGYGLSYTSFRYGDLKVQPEVKTGEPLKVSLTVENTGTSDGEEVVQLYVKHPDAKVPVPLSSLQGFRRIFLKAGEKKEVDFTLIPRQLAVIDNDDLRKELPGVVQIIVGGYAPVAGEIPAGFVRADVSIAGEPFVIE